MSFRNVAVACGAGALVLGALAGSAQADRKLTYGSYVPAGHLIHTQGLEPFFKQVNEATDGSLTFELFPGGAMGGGKAALSSVRDQVVDSALIVDAYVKRDVPVAVSMTDLALLGSNPMVMAGAVNEDHLINCPECVEELAANKVKPLAYYSTDVYYLMCNKSANSLDKISGLKVRATGSFGIWANAMGAAPVSITSSEIYEAIQRGQADCTLGSAAWLRSYNLVDVVTHVTDLPMGTYHGGNLYNMNVRTWQGLSDAERAAILENLPGLVRRTVEHYIGDGQGARKLAEEKGIAYEEPGADLVAKLKAHRTSEIQRVIEKSKEEGIKNPDQIIARFESAISKWEQIVNNIDGDYDKYQAALEREVFSKLN